VVKQMNSRGLGRKLRAYRAKRGWSLKECSERIGISTRYLADIERGDKVPKLETFVSILNTLSASADDVLQESLIVGYEAQSNDILRELGSLDAKSKKQALDIFQSVICVLKKNA